MRGDVPAALRRAQARDRARRGDPAQRPPPQRPRREHPRGRPSRRAARSRRAPRRLLVSRLRDLGATITRSHYPLHPAFLEAFDKYGILYWVDAPVYQIPNTFFNEPGVRAAAKRAVSLTVRNNINHPSIMTWSLANEPAGTARSSGSSARAWRASSRTPRPTVRELDDTRFVAIDRQSRAGEPPTSSAYRYLDVLGVNEYFGWYDSIPGRPGAPPDHDDELSALPRRRSTPPTRTCR